MKTNYFLSSLFSICLSIGGFAQTYIMPASGHTNETTCSGNFYDSGGSADGYSGYEDGIITFCPSDPTKYLTLDFTMLDLEDEYSLMNIYFGSSTSGDPDQQFSGSSVDDYLSPVIQSPTPGGCITIHFQSLSLNPDIDYQGWKAKISCKDELINGQLCEQANAFCSEQSYDFPNATNTYSPFGPDLGCVSLIPNPVWYYMETADPGTIEMTLQQTTGPGGTGGLLDVDFVMYGPFNDLGTACAGIADGSISPVQTSYDPQAIETLGIGVTGGSNYNSDGGLYDCPYVGKTTPPAANTGDIYVVLITNYSGDPGYIQFEQTGGTGSANCDVVENCKADIGTFSTSTSGTQENDTTFVLCEGDDFLIQSNNDYTPPDEIVNSSDPNPPIYDPDMLWAVYSCPPTVIEPGPGVDLNDDPCLEGVFSGEYLNDINNSGSIFEFFPSGTFTDNTIYTVPITTYGIDASDPNTLIYSFVTGGEDAPPCYDYGSIYSIQYLPEITETISPDCHAGTVSVTISGGSPGVNDTDFTISNLLPASATLSTTTIGDGGTVVISGLTDGDNYSFDIVDEYGCPSSISGTFSGATKSDFSYSTNKFCKGDANPTPIITGDGGGTFTKVSGPSGLSFNSSTGQINLSASSSGTYEIEYSSPGAPCNSTTTQTITINGLPTVYAGTDQEICKGENVTLTGQGANSYSWNQGVQDGVPFSPISTNTYTVTGTNTVTGCSNTDQVTVEVNDKPTIKVTSADNSICEGENTNITATGGTSYTWDNGLSSAPSHTVSPTTTTTYTVIGENADNCENTASVEITVHDVPNITASSDVTLCEGESTTITANGPTGTAYSWNNGVGSGKSHIVSPTTSTIYEVTGTDGNGCVNTDNVTVSVDDKVDPTFNTIDPFCAGATAPSLPTTSNNSIPGSWNPSTIDNTSSGNYTFTPNSGECATNKTINVTVNPTPNAQINGASEYCQGYSSTLNAGSGYSQYSWSTGENTQTINVTDADNPITVTVTNSDGCDDTSAPFTVTENTIIRTDRTFDICQGESKVIHGQTETTSGIYTDTLPSMTGCDSISEITLNVNSLPNVDGGNNQAICMGESITLNGSNANSYTWDNGVQDGVPFQPNSTETYTVTGTDNNGCKNTASVTVTVNPLPTADAGSDIEICEEDDLNLTANGGTDYSWSGPNSYTSNDQNPTINDVDTDASGDYTVTVTDANNCSANTSINVSVHHNPTTTASFSPSNPICPGEDLDLHASGSSSNTYNWEGPDNFTGTGKDPFVSNAGTDASGDYIVTVINGKNCTTKDTVSVSIIDNDPPVFNGGCIDDTTLFSDPVMCGVQLPNFTSSSEINITDNCGNVASNTITISQNPIAGTDMEVGTHTVWIIATDDEANMDSCSFQLTVEDDLAPTFDGGCIDDTTLYTDASSCDITVPDFTGDAQLEIVDNCGNIAENTITVTQSPNSGTVLGTGTHTVWIYAEDNYSNTDSCSFQLNVTDTIAPTFVTGCDIDTTLYPTNASCYITVPDFTSSSQIDLTDNCGDITSGTITVTQSPSPGTVLESGNYTGWIYAEDNNSNIDSCSFNMIVGGDTIAPTFTAGCLEDTILYADENSCGVATPDFTEDPQIYVSDNCNDLSSGTITLTQSPASGTPLDVGEHKAWIIATDQSSNSDSCSFYITVRDTIAPEIDIQVESVAYCDGEDVSWIENITDNCQVDSIFSTHDSGDVFSVGTSTVIYTVKDVNGNVSVDSFDVVVDPLPNVPELTKEAYKVCFGTPVTLAIDQPDNNNNYIWIFGNDQVNTGSTYNIGAADMSNNGIYTIIAETDEGCTAETEISLTVQTCNVTVSEAISPNDDNKNDEFVIDGLDGYPNTEVWIYNRWGTEVYHSDDYQNDWDGTSQSGMNVAGDQLPEGTYYYIVKLGGVEDQPNAGEELTGYVYLKR